MSLCEIEYNVNKAVVSEPQLPSGVSLELNIILILLYVIHLTC